MSCIGRRLLEYIMCIWAVTRAHLASFQSGTSSSSSSSPLLCCLLLPRPDEDAGSEVVRAAPAPRPPELVAAPWPEVADRVCLSPGSMAECGAGCTLPWCGSPAARLASTPLTAVYRALARGGAARHLRSRFFWASTKHQL